MPLAIHNPRACTVQLRMIRAVEKSDVPDAQGNLFIAVETADEPVIALNVN